MRDPADAIDVLVIVGAGAGDLTSPSRPSTAANRRARARRRAASRPASAPDARPSDRAARSASPASSRATSLEQRDDLRLASPRSLPRAGSADRTPRGSGRRRTASESRPTGWPPSIPLTLSVACRAPRRHDRHVGRAPRERRHELAAERVEHDAHVLDGAHAEKRHAAVRDAAARRHLEPVDAAMADADAIDVERLRNDHVVGARRVRCGPARASYATPAKPPLSSSTVPLISTDPVELDARAPDRFGGVDRRRDARLHVARAAAVDAAVAHDAAERIDGPALAGGDDVEVAVEVDERPRAPRPRRRPTTLTRGCARVCSGRPSAATYSTSKPHAASRSPMKRAQSS